MNLRFKLEIINEDSPVFRAECLSQESLEEELGRFTRHCLPRLRGQKNFESRPKYKT